MKALFGCPAGASPPASSYTLLGFYFQFPLYSFHLLPVTVPEWGSGMHCVSLSVSSPWGSQRSIKAALMSFLQPPFHCPGGHRPAFNWRCVAGFEMNQAVIRPSQWAQGRMNAVFTFVYIKSPPFCSDSSNTVWMLLVFCPW